MIARRGFTLLEATVALALVGAVAIGALETFGAEARVARNARAAAPAAAIVEERMARLAVVDAALLRALPDSLAAGTTETAAGRYEWQARVIPVAGEPDLYTARVEVVWAGGQTALSERMYRPRTEKAP